MKTLLKSVKVTLVSRVFFSVFYILVLWLFARIASPNQDSAEVVTLNSKVVGAANVGQRFTEDTYFQGRPSCVGDGYDATSLSDSSKGPANPEYLAEVKSRIDAFLVHHPYLSRKSVSAEMVTAGGSGLDPDITSQSACVQVKRVVQAQGMDVEEVRRTVDRVVEKPLLGASRAEKINVSKLNIAFEETKVNRK